MDKPSYKLVGAPCGQHGQYTFYKAIRLTGATDRIVAIGDFFFVRIWQDSELVSIGELQLLWTDRVSDQTLVSLRLYFLPENTPDGRGLHGEDEVLAINEKVVLRAEDLLSWVCDGKGWRWGLRAVWRGACEPPAESWHTQPLHHTKLDFSDVDKEKNAIDVDAESPGVVVFSYPQYCRYRALVCRLEGVQAQWLRESLVGALGGYAAPTKNTSILYCKDTFEYPELEGHEFVCNHLAPKLKGRPRGRRRRPPRSRSHSPSSRSSDSDAPPPPIEPRTLTPRRLSLRNGAPRHSQEEEQKTEHTAEDKAFVHRLKVFYKEREEPLNIAHHLKELSLRALYVGVCARGGYEAVCRAKLWRDVNAERPARTRRHYERYLLPYENHERRNGETVAKPNGRIDEIDTIDVPDSPPPADDAKIDSGTGNTVFGAGHVDAAAVDNAPCVAVDEQSPDKMADRTRDKKVDSETGEIKEDMNVTSKPAEELNREFLESLPKEEKPIISVKPVDKLLEPSSDMVKLFQDNSVLISELAAKHNLLDSGKVLDEVGTRQLSDGSACFLNELAQKLHIDAGEARVKPPGDAVGTDKYLNGHTALTPPLQNNYNKRPVGRSSLRAVRVKPTRPPALNAYPLLAPRPASGSPSGPGLHRAPEHSDDEILEVPYKPKTPEIIDLDEYPESPQSIKKKKLDILKERGLEVTAIPTTPWPAVPVINPITPLINPTPMILNPAMQHQIMTQAQLFQMYNIVPQNFNGVQPPKVIQGTSIFGNSGPEKTVYGNPKDPFMPPPHVLRGAPVKPPKAQTSATPPQDILDLSTASAPSQKPAVEIVRIPTTPSPSKTPQAQNLTKNYTLIDGKAVVGSNLEITLVNPKNQHQTPSKNRPPQKRSSNGKFMSTKTPTPPKEYPKYASPSPSGVKKTPIVVPNYQIRDDVSPTSSTGSKDSGGPLKGQNLTQMLDMQKTVGSNMTPFMDPMYMSALYSSLAGQMDQRQLAMYRDFMANQFKGYSGLLNIGAMATPTTKN